MFDRETSSWKSIPSNLLRARAFPTGLFSIKHTIKHFSSYWSGQSHFSLEHLSSSMSSWWPLLLLSGGLKECFSNWTFLSQTQKSIFHFIDLINLIFSLWKLVVLLVFVLAILLGFFLLCASALDMENQIWTNQNFISFPREHAHLNSKRSKAEFPSAASKTACLD